MPITIEEAPGNLPQQAKDIYVAAFNNAYEHTCTQSSKKERDACAARIAWSAVKRKYRKAGDKWVPKADVQEFSLTIKRASFDKATGEMRWRADTSDIDEDSYGDNMSLELYNDFLDRINKNELAPEHFRSEFWKGGMPYLSVSHYPDFDGDGVPGDVKVIYVDGKFLKAKGTFWDTKLGRACFKAVCDDLYGDNKDNDNKVRVSIAFLDYKHKHKSNGFIFERETLDDFCPECLREMITGEQKGKVYLRGQLIHLAMTRVPVNTRTLMEVDKSMATRKEDAATIIGEELAEELEEKQAKIVGKSEALVIKSDDEKKITEEVALEGAADLETEKEVKAAEETKPVEERAKTKKHGGCNKPASAFLVVEDPNKPSTWHLPVKDCSGNPDHRLMGAAKAALTEGYRGKKYEGPGKATALKKLKALYKSEGLEWKAETEDVVLSELKEIKSLIKPQPHPLDDAIMNLKATYDNVMASEMATPEDKLKEIQLVFNELGETIKESVTSENKPKEESTTNDVVSAFSEALRPVIEQLNLLTTQLSQQVSTNKAIPERRSLRPTFDMQSDLLQKSKPAVKSPTPKLREILERTV